ncbi:MAG: hypothetical protein Q4A32_10055 [Lachnospiraceae bacterium]|nr:hypothetical protein [Lachnospiraceae bacterium]
MNKRKMLLIAGILILSLGGCGKNAESLSGKTTQTQIYEDESGADDASAVSDEKTSDEAKAANAQAGKAPTNKAGNAEGSKTGTDNAQVSKVPTNKAGDAEGSNTGSSQDSSEAPKSFSDGTIVQKTYLQEYFGYRLVLDEDWEFATDKELEEQNRAVAEAAGDEAAFAKIMENGDLCTDMMASNTVTGNAVVVRLAQVGLADVLGKEEERDARLAEAVRADAEAAGLKNIETTATEATFLGKPVKAIGVKGELALSDEYSTEMWYRVVMTRKGEYASVIFVTGFTDFGGDNFQEILDKFEPL